MKGVRDMRFALVAVSLFMGLVGHAASKGIPVAEAYPDWRGVTEQNYLAGRELCPSDLRHRVTIVVEVDAAADLREQFLDAMPLVDLSSLAKKLGMGISWETAVLPRDALVVFSVANAGKDGDKTVKTAIKKGKDVKPAEVTMLTALNSRGCSYYRDVTFPGAPDGKGKRPYFYVMGPTGKEPIAQGELKTAKKAAKAVKKAIAKMQKEQGEWRPFFGFVAEPRHFPQLAAAVEKAKPLASLEKALLRGIEDGDPETASEAQLLYDALCQTCSDLIVRIQMEARACPHRADYDMGRLSAYWPGEKSRVEAEAKRIKETPGAGALSKILEKILQWSDPAFACKNAGEARKIVAQLEKMKKDLEKLKGSKEIKVQNGAATLDVMVDELMASVPGKVK